MKIEKPEQYVSATTQGYSEKQFSTIRYPGYGPAKCQIMGGSEFDLTTETLEVLVDELEKARMTVALVDLYNSQEAVEQSEKSVKWRQESHRKLTEKLGIFIPSSEA